MDENNILLMRLELFKLCYHHNFNVDDVIEKAKTAESYILNGLNNKTINEVAPEEDKVSRRKKA